MGYLLAQTNRGDLLAQKQISVFPLEEQEEDEEELHASVSMPGALCAPGTVASGSASFQGNKEQPDVTR